MKKTQLQIIDRLPFYILAVLILLLPLLFSSAFENSFDLVKGTYFRSFSVLFILISVIVLRKRLIASKFVILINKPLDAGIILLIFAAVLSTIFSINPGMSLYGQYFRQIGLLTYIVLFLIYAVISFRLFTQNEIDNILLIMELAAAIVAVYSLIQYAGIDPFGIHKIPFKRPVSSLGTSVFAAGLMTLILPFSVIRIIQKKITKLYLVVPVIILSGIIVSMTRTAYAALPVQLILFLIFFPYVFKNEKSRFLRLRFAGLIIICGLTMIVILSFFVFPDNIFVRRIVSIASIIQTPRWTLWQTSFDIFKKYPVTGTGISAFSRAIEDFITIGLKDKEASGYYDNAHNNFLHILTTMGVTGFAGYILILFSGLKQSFKNLFNKALTQHDRIIYLAFICSFAGYITYSMADFDDLSIMLYFFVLLGILKLILYSSGTGELIQVNKNRHKYKNLSSGMVILFLCLSIYNIYNSYTELEADRLVRVAKSSFSESDIVPFKKLMTEAISTKPYPNYRFTFAYFIYLYVSGNPYVNTEEKMSILNYAEQQIDTAIADYPSRLDCRSLTALLKYEKGDTVNAEIIKNEVLEKDSLQTTFRINLARYYFKSNREQEGLAELKIVYKYDPRNTEAYFTSILYLIHKREYVYAENCCNAILEMNPGNELALYYLAEIKKLKPKN